MLKGKVNDNKDDLTNRLEEIQKELMLIQN